MLRHVGNTRQEGSVNMEGKRIIIDTDIGPDCDDVGAIALANIYENYNLCNIIGIGHCTSNQYGAGTIDVICGFYGHPNIAIGTYYGNGFLADENCMRYNQKITMQFPNRYRTQKPEEVVSMYRRLLSCQEDHSITFVAIGPLNNLAALIESKADVYSELDGYNLVSKKVSSLVSMGGIFHSGNEEQEAITEREIQCPIDEYKEFNIYCDIKSAQKIAERWPTSKTFLGFELGLMKTGIPCDVAVPDNHPVKMAYDLYTEDGLRQSWDLLTMEYAIDESSKHYILSEPGNINFDNEGHTIWKKNKYGKDKYVKLAQPSGQIASDISRMLSIYKNY